MSGIITANGIIVAGEVGVAKSAGIAAYKVFDGAGTIGWTGVLQALEHIELFPSTHIINMSISDGTPHSPATCRNDLSAVKEQLTALRHNTLTFASAGNAGDKDGLAFPACHTDVVAVGATYDGDEGSENWTAAGCIDFITYVDKVACGSNSDEQLELLAPGAVIQSSYIDGATILRSGTSMASAHAAGVAALLLHAQPELTPDDVAERMKSTGKWVYDDLANRWTPRIDARVASLTNDDGDADGDGCKNGAEFGLFVDFGGQRNPLDPWDFYDVSVPKDGFIDLFIDILGVILHYSLDGSPPYDANFDRGPSAGLNPWNMTAPDGSIDLFIDILGVIKQYGHDCT